MSLVVIRTTAVTDDPSRRALLDAAERDRAARRSNPASFISAHALLRQLVGDFADLDPASLSFARRCATCGTDRHGKPSLVGRPDLHVSVSYGDAMAIAAVTAEGEIGVDIESRESTNFKGFDVVTLAPSERDAFADLRDEELLQARSLVWARKEAVLKATGHGLVVDPTQVIVSAPDQAPALIAWEAEQKAPGAVSLHDIAIGDGWHQAALAVIAPRSAVQIETS